MSDGHPEDSIGRVIHGLTVGTVRAVRKRDKDRAQNSLRELDQQFQYKVSGEAGPVPIFSKVTVNFEYAFFYAPSQRESHLQFPTFTFGSHSSPAVAVHATVEEWLEDETNGSIIGAVVAVAATGENTEFDGWVHLVFQGFGALIEDMSDTSLASG